MSIPRVKFESIAAAPTLGARFLVDRAAVVDDRSFAVRAGAGVLDRRSAKPASIQ
jgi:hypothetical protein